MFSNEFLLSIPKTDLHVHLDGSLRLSTLIELAQENGVHLPSYDETELRRTVFKPEYANLEVITMIHILFFLSDFVISHLLTYIDLLLILRNI